MTDKPVITQAMINAYDEYTHLTLDRRGFMEKMSKLAGSTAAAAVIVPMLAADKARAAIIPPDDARVTGEEITFPGSTGEMKAYLARPAGETGKLGGVVVIHENRGLNDHTRDVARRAAVDGFMALAVDFLSPSGGTPADEDKAREMIGQLDPAQTVANAVAAVAYLAGRDDGNGKVGAVGFCWGGGMVNALAAAGSELDAGVAYYGRAGSAEDAAKVTAPLMLHYAGLDERINAGIDAYKQGLEANGKEFTIHMYDGVNHAFNNDTSAARYDKAASDLAWSRTIAFFKEKLA